MKDLLDYLVKSIAQEGKYEIEESFEDDRIILAVKAEQPLVGMLIGKSGRTIRSIRKVMSIRGTLEHKLVNVVVEEL